MKTINYYMRYDFSEHCFSLPNLILTKYTDIYTKERRTLCQICYTNDTDENPVISVCPNNHADEGICIDCLM